MITPCPHCQAEIEIDTETHAAIAGQSHFACPACQGAVAVPARAQAPVSVHRGINRNLLILGAIALLVLGGIGLFLASQKSGDTNTTVQNIRNEIINNSYFTQLIADGITTKADLEAIADIRPYGNGFIGVSKEALTWEQSQELAKRTGSSVLAVNDVSAESRGELVKWLVQVFGSQLASPVWVLGQGAPGVLASSEILAVKNAEGTRKALFRWSTVGNRDPEGATVGRQFVNSLGMKFVPVPGTKVLMCIHETRRQDYATYAKDILGVNTTWQTANKDGIPSGHENDHPVVGVNWNDAVQFCKWLSQKEGKKYRLPTDREWSIAVGIGDLEPETYTGERQRPQVPGHYPWESPLPIRVGQRIGNYADTTWKETFPDDKFIENYTDGFATTAPVMSFDPNSLGIYDLGGNAQEWAEGPPWAGSGLRVKRGGSFSVAMFEAGLLSSNRNSQSPRLRWYDYGFRVALETDDVNTNFEFPQEKR